jgi:hypothetical protein
MRGRFWSVELAEGGADEYLDFAAVGVLFLK